MALAFGSSRASLLDSVWGLVETALPAIVLAGALVLLLRLLRWSILMKRRRSPRMQITPFAWTGDGDGREALWVTSLFREHLKALRLDGLDPLPDRAPGAPLVEIVEGVGQGVGQSVDLGKALGRLYRAVVPDSGYEVWATLRPSGKDKGTISVQLIDRGRGNRTLANLTSKKGTWDEVAKEAAMAVSGALYPQLSSRHKGPWATWKRPIPPQLLTVYQDAFEHEKENRLEQAMAGFRSALEMDPLNPELRLKVAMLEERLELHLDAWFTYRAIVDEPGRKLWRGPQRRVRLLALYRLAIHLWNPAVATQWVDTFDRKHAPAGGSPPGGAHERDQVKIRTMLETALEKEWILRPGRRLSARDDAAKASSAELADALAEARLHEKNCTDLPETRHALIKPFLRDWAGRDIEARERLIREVLQILSLRYLEELEDRMRRVLLVWATRRWPDKLRRRPPLRRLPRRREFYRPLVKVSMLLVRCRIAAAAGHRPRANGTAGCNSVLEAERAELLRRWPIAMENSKRLPYRWQRFRFWLAERHREDAWVLRYNAACTIAVLLDRLIFQEPTPSEKKTLTRSALAQMEGFAHLARSGHVADMADWIVAGDHDLDGLYATAEFRLWATHHLGFDVPEERPKRLVDPDRFTVLMIKRGAEALAMKWRDRAGLGEVAAGELVGWWREENEIWTGIDRILRERRSWRHRFKVLQAVARWNEENGLAAVNISHESWDAEKPQEALSSSFLTGFSNFLCAEAPMRVWVEERAVQVRDERDDRLRTNGSPTVRMSRDERAAAMRAAKTWSGLAEALDAALAGEETKCLDQLSNGLANPRADART